MVLSLPHSPPATYEQGLHGSRGKRGRSKGKDGVGLRCAWDRKSSLGDAWRVLGALPWPNRPGRQAQTAASPCCRPKSRRRRAAECGRRLLSSGRQVIVRSWRHVTSMDVVEYIVHSTTRGSLRQSRPGASLNRLIVQLLPSQTSPPARSANLQTSRAQHIKLAATAICENRRQK